MKYQRDAIIERNESRTITEKYESRRMTERNEIPASRKINFVPMDRDELVVDWSSGVVKTNIGERILPEESARGGTTTDRSRQQAEELLGIIGSIEGYQKSS